MFGSNSNAEPVEPAVEASPPAIPTEASPPPGDPPWFGHGLMSAPSVLTISPQPSPPLSSRLDTGHPFPFSSLSPVASEPPPPGTLLRAKSDGMALLSQAAEAAKLRDTLVRASSGGLMLEPIKRIAEDDLLREPDKDSRRRHHSVSKAANQEVQMSLARALEATATRVESLASQLEQERACAAERELRLVRALEALSTRSGPAVPPVPVANWPEASAERTVHEQAARAACLVGEEGDTSCTLDASTSPHREEPAYRPYIGRNGRLYEFPEVEVSLKLYQVCNVNTANLTFEADFVCHLDWTDHNVEGMTDEELRALDWGKYFNPYVEIDNCKDNSAWLKGADEIPRRRRPATLRRRGGSSQLGAGTPTRSRASPASGRCFAGAEVGSDGALRKTMRFRGTLSVSSVNLRCFPFDLQVLPVRLKAARCRLSDGSVAPPRSESDRVSLVDSATMMKEPDYCSAEQRHRGRGHYAVPAAGHALLEFDICSLTGCHPDPERGDVYEVTILVERPLFASYICDLFIMNLLVGLAASAFWDTAAPELSSRMSISLTVILTLAAYTSTRPSPIEKAPYVTYHDWCEQMCMFLVTGISIQNVVAVVMCGGHHEEAPPYMTEMFENHRDQCSVGWCLSRKIDCQAVLILLGTWFFLNAYSLIWLVRMRHRTTLGLRQRLHLGRTLPSDDEDGDIVGSETARFRNEASWTSSNSLDSSDSFGSWTQRFCRYMGNCSGCVRRRVSFLTPLRAGWLCIGVTCRVSRCCRRSSQEIGTAPCGSPEDTPRYAQALDKSPGVHQRADSGSSPLAASTARATGARGRPRPLDLCGTFGGLTSNTTAAPRTCVHNPGSAPASPAGSQPRVRSRACPSTPTSAALNAHPSPSPLSSVKSSTKESPLACRSVSSASPRQPPLGRTYSQLSDT